MDMDRVFCSVFVCWLPNVPVIFCVFLMCVCAVETHLCAISPTDAPTQRSIVWVIIHPSNKNTHHSHMTRRVKRKINKKMEPVRFRIFT